MSDTPLAPPAGVSLYDARPFFEKALQYGMQHGLINQAKLDDICRSAPKGMVQIAAYFGSEFLRPELERARDRIVNLVSLYLEDSCQGDLRRAAESLRDHSFLSRSKGGSDMLKRLIVMPQTSHFGMNERQEFSDVHIPQLAKWTLRPLADYRGKLVQAVNLDALLVELDDLPQLVETPAHVALVAIMVAAGLKLPFTQRQIDIVGFFQLYIGARQIKMKFTRFVFYYL